MQPVLQALDRYRKVVAPDIDESYQFAVEITDLARLGIVNQAAYRGLQVRLLAAFVGESMFVDVTAAHDRRAAFAGEEAFATPLAARPPDDASPGAVMGALVDAVKASDLQNWRELFADGWIDRLPDGRLLLNPHAIRVEDNGLADARRLILGRVFDARAVWVGETRNLTDGQAYPGALHIGEVDVELRHYGLFDGEYRSFSDVTVNDFWQLQRVDGGPWRASRERHQRTECQVGPGCRRPRVPNSLPR